MLPKHISDHFSLKEVTFSSTASRLGIDNSQIPEELEANIFKTAVSMDKVRVVLLDKSIHVDSWYRCLELNRKLGSKDTSQHVEGKAVDFICPDFGTPLQICQQLIKFKDLIRFDKLILEHTWIHISFVAKNPRGEVYSLLKDGTYAVGLTDKYGKEY